MTATSAGSGDNVSFWSALAGAVGCGGLMFFVALPLAVSSPFPTPKERHWIVEHTRPVALLPADHDADDAAEAEADLESSESGPEGGNGSPADVLSWEPTFTLAAASMVEVDPTETGSLGLGRRAVASLPPAALDDGPRDEIDDYLWEAYLRTPIKKDGSGDFTWKDPAAAKRMGMSLKDYVIRGMDRDFRETLYHMGKALEADGLRWSILSAFRDDYRQRLASGLKARTGYSLHGGSIRTGGYGHGRAIDITIEPGGDASEVWRWIDRHGARYAIARPMPGYDPAHIQARGNYQQIASSLRAKRSRYAGAVSPRD